MTAIPRWRNRQRGWLLTTRFEVRVLVEEPKAHPCSKEQGFFYIPVLVKSDGQMIGKQSANNGQIIGKQLANDWQAIGKQLKDKLEIYPFATFHAMRSEHFTTFHAKRPPRSDCRGAKQTTSAQRTPCPLSPTFLSSC